MTPKEAIINAAPDLLHACQEASKAIDACFGDYGNFGAALDESPYKEALYVAFDVLAAAIAKAHLK